MKKLTDEERQEQINDARGFAYAMPIFAPLIERRKKDALGRLLMAFRSGKTETMTLIAEIAVLSDLETEMRQKEATYNSLMEKENARRK